MVFPGPGASAAAPQKSRFGCAGGNGFLPANALKMRTKWGVLFPVLMLALLGATSPGTAGPSAPAYRASDNIDHIGHVPVKGGTGGARIIGDYFYVSTGGGMQIYDISDPTKPRRLSNIGQAADVSFLYGSAQEDPDTNGDIYLRDRGGLELVDVSDVRKPKVLGFWEGYQHTYSCISDCDFVYGADGAIFDIRKRNDPKQVGNWQDAAGVGGAHDVTAVTDDLAVVSTTPLTVLNVANPLRPELLAIGEPKTGGYVHGNLWPRNGKDRFLIAGTENAWACNAKPAFVTTFDTRGWQKSERFKPVDEYRVPDLDVERSTPVNMLCGHWFDEEPSFRNGGRVAAAWYEDGMRLLDIDRKGRISEAGYYIRENAASSAAYWVTDEVIYVTDYYDGFDILRVKAQ